MMLLPSKIQGTSFPAVIAYLQKSNVTTKLDPEAV